MSRLETFFSFGAASIAFAAIAVLAGRALKHRKNGSERKIREIENAFVNAIEQMEHMASRVKQQLAEGKAEEAEEKITQIMNQIKNDLDRISAGVREKIDRNKLALERT